MTGEEVNMKKAFNYIKTFYKEAAQMLRDVEEIMGKEGWESEAGNRAITDELSRSLSNPEKWMVRYIYMNFYNNQIPEYTKSILIFFDEESHKFPLSVVCGNVNKSDDKIDKWDLWWLWESNKDKLNGLTTEPVSLTVDHGGRIIDGKVIALSLNEIKSKKDLDKVIRKLLDLK